MNETKLNGQSAEIVSENIQKLKQIFPEVFCEDKIDFEKLKAVLGEYTDDDNERYNFTWWGKSKALRLAQTPSMGTLRPCKEESKDWDTTKNLYIEGDNLEVLKLLQKSYHGKVKMIYIDPPYNTGQDFVYKDNFQGQKTQSEINEGFRDERGNLIFSTGELRNNSKESGRYHTNWLNMMYPRLRLARNLLSDDGVIFISIDYNELDNLKKMCNEVFGEECFKNIIIFRRGIKSVQAQFESIDSLTVGHEYILFYAKNSSTRFELFKIIRSDIESLQGNWNNHWRGTDRPTMRYEIFGITPDSGQWRWSESRSKVAIQNYEGMLSDLNIPESQITQEQIDNWYFMQNDPTIDLLRMSKNNKPEHYVAPSDFKLGSDLWIDLSPKGSTYISQLFGNNPFDNPKPVHLITRMVDYITEKVEGDIVLDYFSGSATTAHAVMQLNAEDGGNRKFIMVQLQEPTDEKSEAYKAGYKSICEIGKERIRRAGEKIKAELQAKQINQPSMLEDNQPVHPDGLDIGFKVFKLDTSNLKKWNPDTENLEESLLDAIENYVDGRSELDVVYEIMLKYGIDLTLPLEKYEVGGKKIYSVGYGALMICLDRDITTEVANEIVRLKEKLNPEVMRVVFKDNGFKDDSVKTNTKEILRNAGIDEIVSI